MDLTAGRDAREAARKAAPAETLTAALTEALDGRWGSLRREVRAQLASAGMRDGSGLPMEEYDPAASEFVISTPRSRVTTPSCSSWWPRAC